MKILPQINILVPMYNEQAVFDKLINRLNLLMNNSKLSIEVILVDDGSSDNTPILMRNLSLENEKYHSIFLSRNFGHQYAVVAALRSLNATEAVFIIDGDLQDPPELLPEFYKYYKEGYEVIYGVRQMRNDEGFIKKITSKWFYRFLKIISNYDIPYDSGDFSLISRRVADYLAAMPEQAKFVRGMRAYLGFKQIGVSFERKERAAGETKYSLKKMINLALDALFGFSDMPYRFITVLGISWILISFAYLLFALFKNYFMGGLDYGFTAIISIMIFSFGIIMIGMGIIGGYVIRSFFQTINRPDVIIDFEIKNQKIIRNHHSTKNQDA